ncbi:MAG TPA: BTAD domain-containing putative transcriptional regulator, partial [Ktedonobacteraceae bacterium]|nr:BTAD domain-containing putative transcriptional regulator [Ktedonobacteraceae bacterium]
SGETPVTGVDVPRLQSLLAYLAMHHTAPQPRSHLAYLMWPESTDTQALTNLRNAIHRLRHTLPSADSFLHVTRQGLQWLSERPNISWTLDVLDFEQALTQAKQAEQANDLTAKRKALVQAANLYRGDLLPSCYDEWMLPERDRLHQAFLGALEQLIALLEDTRDYRGAIAIAQRLLRHDPLRETTYRHLMRLYAISGDRAAALRTYHTCVTTLERELAAQPVRATREAYERLMQMGEQAVPLVTPYTAVSAAPLVGRQKEWTQLEGAWHRAITGHPHLFVLSGEAGIGKSHLAEELLIWVGRQGIAAASASCYAAESTLAYTPVSAWLQTNVFQASLATLPALWLTEVARLLPELLVQRPDLPRPEPMQEGWQRQHFFQALARATLGAHQPLLLLLDDLHWCDAETLSWLHYLLRFDPQAQLFLVATMRTEETASDHPVASWLLGLQREHLATEVVLEPLNAADTVSLAEQVSGGNLTTTAVANLYRETEGNPLFVVETVRAGFLEQGNGGAPAERGPLPQRGSRLPPTVQAVLAARFAQLSPLARQIAGVAAVIGREFTFDVLAHTMKDNEDALVLGLDELWQRRIVRERGGDAYDFSHDKLREAAYAALSSARRRLLHRSVAQALESLYAPALDAHLAELAYHFYEAGNWTQAQEYAQLAGKKALALYAPQVAIEHFSRTLDAVERLSMTPSPALTRARGQAYEVLGEFSRARTDYEMALQLAHARGERETEWEALLNLGMLWTSRDYERSGAYFQRAFELARTMSHPSTLARSLNRVGNWHLNLERPQEALQHHQEALTIFQELQDPHGIAETLDLLGMTSYLGGDLVRGTIYYDEAVALFRQLDDRQGLTSSLVSLALRSANYQTDTMIAAPTRLAEVVSDGERGLQIAREIGQRSAEAYALIMLGFCQGPRGDYAPALSSAQQGLAIAEAIEHRQWMTAAHCALGALYRDLLIPSMALQHLEQALALARETSSWHWIRTATGYLASTYILQGGLEQAESILKSALDPSTPAQTLGQRLAWFAQAELALARGNPVLTLQVADQLTVSAANISGTRIIPRLWKLRGEALTLLNQSSEAEALLQSAREEAHAQGSQSLLWRIHLTLGSLYHAQQRYPEAKEAFVAGRTIIEDLATRLPSESLRNQFLSSAIVQIPSDLH